MPTGTAILRVTDQVFAELLKLLSSPGDIRRFYTVENPLPADAKVYAATVLDGVVSLHLSSDEWIGDMGEVNPTFTVAFEK